MGYINWCREAVSERMNFFGDKCVTRVTSPDCCFEQIKTILVLECDFVQASVHIFQGRVL